MLQDWTLSKLDEVKNHSRVVLRDSLHLLREPEKSIAIDQFGRDNNFAIIVAATNLAFRERFKDIRKDTKIKKLLLIDRAPIRRQSADMGMSAPSLFYPDFVDKNNRVETIDLDLQQFLKQHTGDDAWPQDCNEPRYARLIANNLDNVLDAYKNLRTAHTTRFTDHDFKTIVAFSALGIPDSAFKNLDPEFYWKIGLLSYEKLDELESLVPEITQPIREALKTAPAPYCHFKDHDQDEVVKAFYLSGLIEQHTDNWNLLLSKLDPNLGRLSDIDDNVLSDIPELIAKNSQHAISDFEQVETHLSAANLKLLLVDQFKIDTPEGFATLIEKEKYSSLFRSLALLMVLENLLGGSPAVAEQKRVEGVLVPENGQDIVRFVDTRSPEYWNDLKEAWELTRQILPIRDHLASIVRILKLKKTEELSFGQFWQWWNEDRINRLEYFISTLSRHVNSSLILPRNENDLPSVFVNAYDKIKKRVNALEAEVYKLLDELNVKFQGLVSTKYTSWMEDDSPVRLNSQFIRRCLKPNWDPEKESAVVFVFDGMRYDIWDELLRPLLEDRMEIIEDLPASSILPTETIYARKAIAAGTFPDEFSIFDGEHKLLQTSLERVMGFTEEVKAVDPDASGFGETVHYKAGSLDYYIFELCDKELHNIRVKRLQSGVEVPSRPISLVYKQLIKNIIDTEVMAIVRKLEPGTKVFITADHGFGRVHRNRLGLEIGWVNEPNDCLYSFALLRESLDDLNAHRKVRENVLEFPVSEIRLPTSMDVKTRNQSPDWEKQFASAIFPKVGYALARPGPGARFNPDAYSHGGITLQEMVVPMVALKVRLKEQGAITLDAIIGPDEVLEDQTIEFKLRLVRHRDSGIKDEDLKVEVDANWGHDTNMKPLEKKVLYIGSQSDEVLYQLKADLQNASDDELRSELIKRTMTITVSYQEGRKLSRKSRSHSFSIRRNPDRISRRVPSNLGSILGLTPKRLR